MYSYAFIFSIELQNKKIILLENIQLASYITAIMIRTYHVCKTVHILIVTCSLNLITD